MKKEKKPRKPHLLFHGITMALKTIFLIAAIVLTTVASSFEGTLDGFASGNSVEVTEDKIAETNAKALELAYQVQGESTVLLRNENATLPLTESVKKVNVFGWASTDWLGGGSGSGGVTTVEVDFLQALADYGIETNGDLTAMYEDFQAEREYKETLHSWPEQSCRMYEPSISNKAYYTEALLADSLEFSDTAIVVLGRISGESNDATQAQYKRVEKAGDVIIDETRTYLDLSTEELELLTYVGANYENVIVVLNTANVMTLGELETIPGIDACVMAGFTGQYGATVLPEILWGETNPSGKTVDTWAYDFTTAASYANAAAGGVGAYTNADGLYPANGTSNGNLGETYLYEQVSYADYVEGIYIGYKWYETADVEGYWKEASNEHGTGYEAIVQYPFGYGLSYTTFKQEIVATSPKMSTSGKDIQEMLVSSDKNKWTLTKDGEISVTVKVTNTGTVGGKEIVQLYYTAPYTKGGIEKSAVELAAFGKTGYLEPGKSEEITLTFDVSDMASYDCYDANGNGFTGYELDAGDYVISLRQNAHNVTESITYHILTGIQYETDPITDLPINNKFTGEDAMDGFSLDGSDSEQNITYLTRTDFVGTFPKENVESRPMTDELAAVNLYTEEQANAWIDESAEDITTGAKNGLKVMENNQLTDLGKQLGADYKDSQWESVLDQLTMDEMLELVTHGYGHNADVDSIGKPIMLDADGPAQIGGFTGMNPGTGFSSSSTLAQSWNAELARAEGQMIGHQAAERGYSGWYAPAVNMHRSPFNGRNYEYYSEDSLLSGEMCGNTVAGSLEAGTYSYVKHYLCNDGESGIYRDSIYIWMTEQAIRETYLEPFRIIVEKYGATGLMSSYNRVGANWAGGSKALLTGILRDEWGFEGAVITDYSDHHEFMNGDEMLRAGGDLWMDGIMPGTLKFETESNSFKQALRQASKNIIYMTLNAQVENLNYVAEHGETSMISGMSLERPILVSSGMALWEKLVIAVDIIAVLLFVQGIRAIVLDVKTKKLSIQNN